METRTEMADYSRMDSGDFRKYLQQVLQGYTPESILAIPGVYEILSEELHYEVLDAWEYDNPEKAHPDDEKENE